MFPDSSSATLRRVFSAAALVLLVAGTAWSASYKVLYNFTAKSSNPSSGLIVDAQGNAYGTTSAGGHNNAGSVYELSPTTGYHLLYAFSLSGPGGRNPQGNLVFDSAGNLYGTTVAGGLNESGCNGEQGGSCGVVFKLSPPSNGVGQWTETVLYSFCSQANCTDGANPQSGVIFDSAGNLYGTTYQGGSHGFGGTVFELSPNSGRWTETVLHSFGVGDTDGIYPYGGLTFDAIGNLYGTTTEGGSVGAGTLFELTLTGSGWAETVLYNFCSQPSCSDGEFPYAGVTFDAAGNLFGTTIQGGNFSCSAAGCGIVFELTPSPEGSWAETTIHTFGGRDGATPYAGVVLDSSGDIYGTTLFGGIRPPFQCGRFGLGTVFKLTPGAGGEWRQNSFHFYSEEQSGCGPMAAVTLDSGSNLYGTTTVGGANVVGALFVITQ